MNYLKPSMKVIFTAGFLLAVILASEYITEMLQNLRNMEVYELMTEMDSEVMESIESALETSPTKVTQVDRAKIEEIHYRYLIFKWLLFSVLSYIGSCFLHYRLQSFGSST